MKLTICFTFRSEFIEVMALGVEYLNFMGTGPTILALRNEHSLAIRIPDYSPWLIKLTFSRTFCLSESETLDLMFSSSRLDLMLKQ